MGRHTGEYITLEYRDLPRCDAHTQKLLAALVAQGVRSLLPREGEVLVVGLGNRNVTADALGTRGGGAHAGDAPPAAGHGQGAARQAAGG